MGSTDKFCLRWNDFHDNISGTFRELRKENDFFDVTLVSTLYILSSLTTLNKL
jgi:hypothetical protein